MRTDPDTELARLAACWGAEDPAALYRALLFTSVGRPTADHFEPVQLFLRHHEHDPTNAEVTALMLCTDDRWRRGTDRLVAAIEGTWVMSHEQLDVLAGWLLWSDQPVVHVPTEDGAGTLPADRRLQPPLRRWAAARIARRGLNPLGEILDRTQALDTRHGYAVLAGLLDAADALKPGDRARVLELGLASGHRASPTPA